MAAQSSTTDSVFKALTKPLDYRPRIAVERRYKAMVRELVYLQERQNEHLVFLRKREWSDERLRVLFALNCLYQEVIGPLDASTRTSNVSLGWQHPISYGQMRFDRGHSYVVRRATEDFFTMVSKLGFLRGWMTKNTCGDLVYWIARHEREGSEEEAGD